MAFDIIYNIASGYSYNINMDYIQYSRGSLQRPALLLQSSRSAWPSTRLYRQAIIRIWLNIIIIIHVRRILSAVRLQYGIQLHYNIASGYSYIITMADIQYRPPDVRDERVQLRWAGWSAHGAQYFATMDKYKLYTFIIIISYI